MYGMYGCTEMKTGVYGWDGMYGLSPRVYGLRNLAPFPPQQGLRSIFHEIIPLNPIFCENISLSLTLWPLPFKKHFLEIVPLRLK